MDGNSLTSGTFSHWDTTPVSDMSIGYNEQDTIDSQLEGRVSSTIIYNKALTQQEISDIYNYEKNFRAIDIDDGLMAFYPLKNNSLDNYYNEYDGTDTDMTYDGDSGVFNGTSGGISTQPIFNTDVNIAISAWINATESTVSQYQMIFRQDDSDNRVLFSLQELPTTPVLTLGVYTDGAYGEHEYILPSYTDFCGAWRHIVGTVSSNSVKLFIDNVEVLSTSISSASMGTNTTNTTIGYHATDSYLNGSLSNLRIYNRALSAEEIEVIYNVEGIDNGSVDINTGLEVLRTYEDCIFDGSSIKTRIELKALGNTCKEISADLWKEPSKTFKTSSSLEFVDLDGKIYKVK